MRKIFRKIFYMLVFVVFLSGNFSAVYSQENDGGYSILFGWKTEGSVELLAKKATAFNRLKDNRSIAISFGSLLGPTRIVQYDEGLQFLASAQEAGIDYVIPAASEFIFGVEVFKSIAECDSCPGFISANLIDEKTRETLVDPYVIWNVTGLRICIIAMSDMNTLIEAQDANVRGVDIISHTEALESVSAKIALEDVDLVIAAGRMDRKAIMDMTVMFPFVDAYITNNQSGGFADSEVTTTTVYVAGKPVYIGSESSDHLGFLNVKNIKEIETKEFADITLGDEYPPDKGISSKLNKIIEILKKKDYEESVIKKTGTEVASVLKSIFKVDAVLLERQCLYYYPLKDSLTVLNVRNVIKPGNKLVSYILKGELLKSVLEQIKDKTDPDLRLVFSGITDDGKVDSIPVQNDREYLILTTVYLRNGGNGYEQFASGTNEKRIDGDILKIVESYLVAKEKRLRIATKKKIWDLVLNLDIGSNFNRSDIDKEKQLYGNSIPKEMRKLMDQMTGYFSISSWNNNLTIKKNRHLIFHRLNLKYRRSGFKSEESGKIIYQETDDYAELYNKYTYDLPTFTLKPYLDVTITSELHSSAGKHPIAGSASAGFTHYIPFLWMNFNVGLDGSRNYFTNENSFGTKVKLTVTKSFSENKFFTQKTSLFSDTNITYKPMAKYQMAFALENTNIIKMQIWNKFNMIFDIKSYLYQDSRHRKLVTGFIYEISINYGMDWKF